MTSKVWTLAEVSDSELARLRLDCRPTGLPSGIGIERRVPGGIPCDKVTTLFAESGSFKTTVLGNMLLAMARAGHRVLSVTLEDSKELAAHRFLAGQSGLAYGEISGGTLDAADVGRLAVSDDARAVASRIWVVDDIEPRIEVVLELALKAKQSSAGLGCLAIDYLQLLEGPGLEKDVLARAVKSCARFAGQHKVAVVLVSQQRQESERDRADPRPLIGDMFGSSAMRMGSKLVLALFRPWNYCRVPGKSPKWATEYGHFIAANPDHLALYPRFLEVHCLKNVLGDTRPVLLLVNPATGTVEPGDAIMAPYL